MEKGWISGSVTLLLLKLLERKDMYGYEIITELNSKSNNLFEMKVESMYPLLKALEQKQCVETYEKKVGSTVKRYYSLTKNGKKLLREREREWKRYVETVQCVMESGATG